VLTVVVALVLAASGPPRAWLTTDTAHVPLAISSWCWGTHCGAPIGASTKVAGAPQGTVVRVDFGFAVTSARVAIAGRAVPVERHGKELTWRATRGGGLTIRVTGGRGWVTYVGRIKLR
jgi:hypothetical protein